MKVKYEQIQEFDHGFTVQRPVGGAAMFIVKFFEENDAPLGQQIFIVKKPEDIEDEINNYLNPKPPAPPTAEVLAYRQRKEIAKKRGIDLQVDLTYVSKRILEYPEVTDQLDAIMKWVVSEKSVAFPPALKEIALKCMEVKNRNPKDAL